MKKARLVSSYAANVRGDEGLERRPRTVNNWTRPIKALTNKTGLTGAGSPNNCSALLFLCVSVSHLEARALTKSWSFYCHVTTILKAKILQHI